MLDRLFKFRCSNLSNRIFGTEDLSSHLKGLLMYMASSTVKCYVMCAKDSRAKYIV